MLRYWECVETSTLDQGLCVGALCKSEEEPHIGYERVIWKEISKEEYHKKLNIGKLNRWLSENTGHYIDIEDNDGRFVYNIYEKQKGCDIEPFEWVGIVHCIKGYNNFDDAYGDMIIKLLTVLLKK